MVLEDALLMHTWDDIAAGVVMMTAGSYLLPAPCLDANTYSPACHYENDK